MTYLQTLHVPLLLLLLTSPVLSAITCLKVNSTATAKWTNSHGQKCEWKGMVGSNFGVNTVNGGIYDCNGRCGAGCAGMAFGNVYTQNCFSHDICSYFNNAAGGSADPNCGTAFRAAEDDTVFGYINGCSETNPEKQPERPGAVPVCV